ncbi:MAG: type II secretion system secretin GspD [Pseudomonadota bacterium]
MNTPVRHVLRRPFIRLSTLCVLLFATQSALAQDQDGGITPNYKQADIRQVVEAVSAVTGKSFIVDPRVNAEVTMLSSQPMTPDAFYETFLSILEVYGYVAVENAGIVKILPNANVRQMPGGPSSLGDAAPDDVVTRVIEVQNVGAAQLVPILRPLVPQYGHLAAHAPSNMLIISDRAANVQRMLRIIRRIDQAGDEEIEVVPLLHASATELVRVLQSLAGQPRPDQSSATNLVADERTNSILIGGERSSRLRLRALIAHLDTPLEDGGNMQVRYLRYANATELADKLQSQFQEAAEGGANGAAGAQTNAPFSIWADEQTNALIVTAPPKIMRSLMGVVDKLDIRRAQVLVEAIIVEVSLDNNLDLGVTWAAYDTEGNTPFASTDFPGSDRRTISSALATAGTAGDGNDLAQAAGLIGTGATFGLGRITDNGISFGAIISALAGDGNTNIISTPTIVTMDNEEARIEVGQEVPFVTGSFSNTGGGVNNGVNPFQTINRERVGTLLEITPQINEGNAILLNIRQETSSISTSAVTASDLITNERVIETSVIVDDGGILVLGGLIDDEYRESEQRVPLLGRIPILGNLFKATNRSKEKTNLMVFIRPKILRDGTQTAIETNAKYNYIRDIQLEGVRATQGQPLLPPVESYRPSEAEPVDLRDVGEETP